MLAFWISGQIFDRISSFPCNKRLRVVLNGKILQEYLVLNLQYLVLHFFCYALMTFLMLSIILLSILMILPSTLTAIRHLICGSNLNWLLNLNLIYETLWTGAGCGLLISILENYSFRLTGLITLVLLMWKWIGLFLRKNHLFRCWG